MREAIVASAVRTAVGSFGGALRGVSIKDLGAAVIKEALRRAEVAPALVDEVIMGNVNAPATCLNVGKEAALRAGIPAEVPGFTVCRLCGSGLQAINLAAMMIGSGVAEVVVAGGVENMSDYPFALFDLRYGRRMGNAVIVDEAAATLRDEETGVTAGYCAELLAEKYHISREEQDEFAYQSQMKARHALQAGLFKEEIVPLPLPSGKGTRVFEVDEHPKPDTTRESLARLPAVFKKGGTVTPGNSCGMNDGASALVLVSADRARELKLAPLARVVSYAVGSVEPLYFGEAPVIAVNRALRGAGLNLDQVDLIECNEAFAAQTLACERGLNWDRQRLNVNGGAIALGHPLGATGGKITTTLLHELKRRRGRYGLATACTGGGMGVATIFEMI
ncbi:MAG: thiolase family protein [Syntrophomonadaceae bacterium]|nr:thiolase family protein [Syntrophomonadaceae bacterium]